MIVHYLRSKRAGKIMRRIAVPTPIVAPAPIPAPD